MSFGHRPTLNVPNKGLIVSSAGCTTSNHGDMAVSPNLCILSGHLYTKWWQHEHCLLYIL